MSEGEKEINYNFTFSTNETPYTTYTHTKKKIFVCTTRERSREVKEEKKIYTVRIK